MESSNSAHNDLAQSSDTRTSQGRQHLAILGESSAKCTPAVCLEKEPQRPSGPITTANVILLLEWQRYRCALTGRKLTPDAASLDHIVPVRNGGEHVIENVQVLHRDVNRAKSTMNNNEFVALCRDVVTHTSSESTKG